MIIQSSQKTTTTFAITMDNADLLDLVDKSLRARMNVAAEDEGVTVAVILVPDADGATGAHVTIAIENVLPVVEAQTAPSAPTSPITPSVDTTPVVTPDAAPASDGAAAPVALVPPVASVQAPTLIPGFRVPAAPVAPAA